MGFLHLECSFMSVLDMYLNRRCLMDAYYVLCAKIAVAMSPCLHLDVLICFKEEFVKNLKG